MKDPIFEAKKELIEWIRDMYDLEKIQELLDLKNKGNQHTIVAESQAEYVIKDDFDERFAKGLTSAESRKRTKEFIGKLP